MFFCILALQTPSISAKTESTNRRSGATKLSTVPTTNSLTKKPTAAKTTDDRNKKTTSQPIGATTTDKSKVKSTTSSTHLTTPKASYLSRKIQDPKQNAEQKKTGVSRSTTSSINAQTRNQPLRAKHAKEIKPSAQKSSTKTTTTTLKSDKTKHNSVLDTPHNVTVSSPPPPKRKAEKVNKEENERRGDNTKPQSKPILNRKNSRVLEPDEIVVLKRESAKRRLEEQILRDNIAQQEQQNSLISLPDPVAFEVNFDENTVQQKNASKERSRFRATTEDELKKTPEDETNYSDDFDSYESDFDTETSSPESTTQKSSKAESQDEDDEEEPSEGGTPEEEEDDSANEIDDTSDEDKEPTESNKDCDETEDDSELTQDPITVLQRDKERKLDSGHYDMNSRRNPKLSDSFSSQSTHHQLVDSLEAFTSSLNTSDQLDSGISAYGIMTSNASNPPLAAGNFQVFYGGYKDFTLRPIRNKRGTDLMAKIQFDTLGFTLLELKPISYDVYMQTFGRLHTGQAATQTQDDLMHVEQQTDAYELRSMWTQHPAQYDLEMVQQMYQEGSFRGMFAQNCCGELSANGNVKPVDNSLHLDESLETLKHLEYRRNKRNLHNYVQSQRKPVNYDSLNTFLLRSSLVINQILGSTETKKYNMTPQQQQQQGNLSRITDSCYELDTNFLNTLKVVKIFSNPCHNLFVTVHESLPETDVYKSDFTQLLMVWCINSPDKPLRLLTTWSSVSRLEISHDASDIIVAALRDGSVALWDLRETYSFCSKLDGYLTHFAATQSIVPSWESQKAKSAMLMDLGACLDIKSFRSPKKQFGAPSSGQNGIKSQFVSLHDSGILTVWSLVESTNLTSISLLNSSQKSDTLKYSMKLQQKFGYSSPWARVKLIQSSIVQLKDFLDSKPITSQSRFDKTKSLFQRNIYNDVALKELHDNNEHVGQQGLRFSSIECGSETIYICANRNFILMCSKTLKRERFRRITLNESRLLFPTALKVLSNEHFLAVGLSNGAVMILNCAWSKQHKSRGDVEKRNTPGTPFPEETLRSAQSDIDPISRKSCAIQNIVLNSQKSLDSMDFNTGDEFRVEAYRPDTAAFIALIDSQQKPFELRVYDQQVILSGSVLRQNLIQSLDLSSDGWRLFAITNNRIRIYDFCMDQEIGHEEDLKNSGSVMDIGCSKANSSELKLLTLEKESKVIVYNLKK